ncbi:MAG: ATP-dependent DNA helicase [Patescibacteria group bacterium]
MDTLNKKLNKQQLQAIKHNKGPLLIIAGAGTGKTTVITERIKYLILKGFAKPEEILALTFTEKGATEMETRIDVALPLGYGDMWVSTFHSFCDRILRDSAIEIGLSSSYKLMTQAQSIDLIKKNLFDFNLDYYKPLGNPNKFIEGLLQHFSRLQDETITPSEYLTWVNSTAKRVIESQNLNSKISEEDKLEQTKRQELANAYEFYTKLKLKNNVLDFGDLITYTIKLFKDRPNVLKIYQEKFKYILVDEFQDTNFAQNELVNLLAQKGRNITVVGDDNQSIYRFRGAAISNIIQFKNTYKDAKIVTLNENYRSTQKILDGAYRLIKHNDPDTLEYQLGISKKLISNHGVASSAYNKKLKNKIEFIHTNTGQDEAEEVAKEINKLVTRHSSPYNYSDIAILVRANNHADSFIREFERVGIPHQFLGPSKLFEKEETVDLISYLKVLYNPGDSVPFYRLLNSDIFELPSLELIKIMAKVKKNSLSIFEVITESKNEKIVNLLKIIDKHLKLLKSETAGQILYDYINEVGIYQKIIENSEDIKAKNIAKFFEKIKTFEESSKDACVTAVVDYIDLLMEVGESPNVTEGDWQENNAVNILTVHSSKGLEFPVVFLVNLVGERFPSRERHEQIPIPEELIKEVLPKGDYHTQEERRLFYVGMTRAKERLYLTAADYYGDGVRQKKISPFVMEAIGEVIGNRLQVMDKLKLELKKRVSKKPSLSPKTYNLLPKVRFLSVTQIETFKTCPLHYKLKYIYKLPTPPSASISFGVSIHNTLKEMLNAKNANVKWLLEQYKKEFIEEGYINKKHKQEFYKKGEGYLLGFLENGYNPKTKTIALEEKFTLKISSDFKIGGTIDRIDDLGSGRYEIIDYKTGANIPTQKDVDKDMQLSFYALAVSTLYKVKPEDIKLSLYYLDTQEKITTHRTAKQLEKLKKEILEIKKEIENSDFKCNNNYFCQQGCEFSMFCKTV